ncbi:EDEM2 [Bugula neritina]|uniref:alpha-1,2-Mannosidase n=1 Tax=Bugula neritina TaxID=10212 RepID=A0A7J7JR22_BUGNE|nr:EDEM2 [Bugula neritina]
MEQAFWVHFLVYLCSISFLQQQVLGLQFDQQDFHQHNCQHEFLNKKDLHHTYREKAKRMFYHAYDGYMQYAYPLDELRPITCDGHDTWGSYSLSLIDALDTLIVLGNYSEFRRVVDIILTKSDFDKDINVSVFETNIRVVGGLLSAHLFSHRGGLDLEPGWPCNGPLLRLAESLARRLLPAFDTPTSMPYGTVNLKYGVPVGETPVTCTAGVGTFMVEFGALSRLTGDPIFENVASRAMDALWKARSPIGLVGKCSLNLCIVFFDAAFTIYSILLYN